MRDLIWVFFKYGCLGFGGPIAVVGMFEEEFVERKKWLTTDAFARVYSICKLLPGPVSVQVAIYIGKLRAGTWGGIVAGVVFILPAFFVVLILSVVYTHTDLVKNYGAFFSGLQAGALAVIALSALSLSKPYQNQLRSWAIFAVSAGAIWRFPRWEPLVILAFGWMGVGFAFPRMGRMSAFWPIGISGVFKSKLLSLFWMCFKAGAFTFGTGLAIVPMLEADSVRHYGFLTHSQFMDGLTLGQVTPGPVVITATFIGYQVARVLGAVIATLGIFLPSFINVLIIVPRIFGNLEKSAKAERFTAWAMPAVIGGIAGAGFRLTYMSVHTWQAAAVLIVAFGVSLRWKIPAWALILSAGAIVSVI